MDEIAENDSNLIVFAKNDRNLVALTELRELEIAKLQMDSVVTRLAEKVSELVITNRELNRKIAHLSNDIQSARDDLERAHQKEYANRRQLLEVIRQAGDIYSAAVNQVERVRRESRERFARHYQASRRKAIEVAPFSPQEAREIMTRARNDSLRAYQETEVRVLTLLEKAKLDALGLLDSLELEDSGVDMLFLEAEGFKVSSNIPAIDNELSLISDANASTFAEVARDHTEHLINAHKDDSCTEDDRANSVEMVLSSFDSFAALSSFYQNMRSQIGINGLKILSFDKGTLRLKIDVTGGTSLTEYLLDLLPSEAQIIDNKSGCVHVTLTKGR